MNLPADLDAIPGPVIKLMEATTPAQRHLLLVPADSAAEGSPPVPPPLPEGAS